VLLIGNIIQVVVDHKWINFIYSYPNLIPLPAKKVSLEVFETTFGNPDPRLIRGEGNRGDEEKFKHDHVKAWNGMAMEGSPLTDETILVVELLELMKEDA
jgi:hypothetical protein